MGARIIFLYLRKPSFMRTLFIAAGIMLSIAAFAQAKTDTPLQSLLEKYSKKNPMDLSFAMPSPGTRQANSVPGQPVYSHKLPSGAEVYSLPQDNMPCIVPRTYSAMQVLPGVKINPDQPGAIPNAGYAPLVIPVPEEKAMNKPK